MLEVNLCQVGKALPSPWGSQHPSTAPWALASGLFTETQTKLTVAPTPLKTNIKWDFKTLPGSFKNPLFPDFLSLGLPLRFGLTLAHSKNHYLLTHHTEQPRLEDQTCSPALRCGGGGKGGVWKGEAPRHGARWRGTRLPPCRKAHPATGPETSRIRVGTEYSGEKSFFSPLVRMPFLHPKECWYV